jgi:hypothetical protein
MVLVFFLQYALENGRFLSLSFDSLGLFFCFRLSRVFFLLSFFIDLRLIIQSFCRRQSIHRLHLRITIFSWLCIFLVALHLFKHLFSNQVVYQIIELLLLSIDHVFHHILCVVYFEHLTTVFGILEAIS